MKKISYILISLFALSFLFNACNEDFLELYPQDQISSAIYFKHAADFELYANQFYPDVFWDRATGDTNEGWNQGLYDKDKNSDNMIKTGDPDSRLAGYNSVPSSGGAWEADYEQIRAINYGIVNIDKCEDDPSAYNQFAGELYFFRAFYYFDLVKTYGAASWVDKPLNPDSEELYNPRVSRTEIINHILSDLDKAADLMNSGRNMEGTRLSKEVAYAFKSRVALYEGTWEKYHTGDVFKGETDGTDFLQQAEKAAKDVMDSGIYSVYNTGEPDNDYFALFTQLEYSSNDEVLIWKKYDKTKNFVHHHTVSSRKAYNLGPTRELASSYLSLDGLPRSISPNFDESQCDERAAYEADHLDPRFAQSFAYPDAVWATLDGVSTYWYDDNDMYTGYPAMIDAKYGSATTPTGYVKRKAFNPYRDLWNYWADEDFGIIFLRFGEVLLNYAEAKAELGTITQDDIDISINVLRDRVGMPHLDIANIIADPKWDFPGLSPVINEIRRERRVELAFEGFRLDDILRWAAADELVVGKRFKGVYYPNGDARIPVDENNYVDRLVEQLPSGYGFKLDRDYLEAIPNKELTLNENLKQNPGW
jgi:hypothetical protein